MNKLTLEQEKEDLEHLILLVRSKIVECKQHGAYYGTYERVLKEFEDQYKKLDLNYIQ